MLLSDQLARKTGTGDIDRGMTVDELNTGMTDDEILAQHRRLRPHFSSAAATGTYRAWLKFRHLGALAEEKQQEAADAERHRLRRELFRPQS